jgi:hypothetical protein
MPKIMSISKCYLGQRPHFREESKGIFFEEAKKENSDIFRALCLGQIAMARV